MVLLTLPLPRIEMFEWFSTLYLGDYLSGVAAYLARRALNETRALVRIDNTELFVEAPEISLITRYDYKYDRVQRIATKISNSFTRFTKPEEFEYGYKPDTLGFYLPKPIEGLEPGIYILLDRIARYSTILERIGFKVDPNAIVGTVFLHEYGHLLLHLVGFVNVKQRSISKAFGVHELEEAICEGIAYSLLSESLRKHFYKGMLNEDSVSTKASIDLGRAVIEIDSIIQLIDRDSFLIIPRPYPYSLVRNFFANGCELGWTLVNDYVSRISYEFVTENSGKVKPRVFLVISNASRTEIRITMVNDHHIILDKGWKQGLIY